MNFDLDHETRRKLGYKLIDAIDGYFSSLPELAVQLPTDRRTFGELRNRMPELGEDAAKVFDEACRDLMDKGFHVPSANYFGLMNPTPTYMAVLAEALVAALNPQLATMARSQLASKIERESVRWIGERVGWPGAFDGTFTSGGNEANFSALALALAHHFPSAIEQGVASIGRQPVLYASCESHHSLDKSAGLLGLGRKALRRIAVNEQLRLDPKTLEAAIQQDLEQGLHPFCVVATSGTTNSGALDDLEAISEICLRHNLWLHVDGAYGAAAIFSDKHRNLVRGIEKADSITIDPHKWLAMPFAAGVVLTRHPQTLQQAFAVATPYMPKALGAQQLDNFKVSTQWSRRMNSLKFWLTMRVHGRQAYEELIDRQLALARQFANWIKAKRHFELVVEPDLTIVNFRVKLDGGEDAVAQANAAIVEDVTRDGRRWISSTDVNGRSVIRMMVISYLTGDHQIRALQQALTAAVQKLSTTIAAV
ncbi:MAG: pyridoxal-dependent decarboxylase [Acidobacteriales bacterium]|nr:pyridoxal-dependent decarboxylase [Terriglobales bacterium]